MNRSQLVRVTLPYIAAALLIGVVLVVLALDLITGLRHPAVSGGGSGGNPLVGLAKVAALALAFGALARWIWREYTKPKANR